LEPITTATAAVTAATAGAEAYRQVKKLGFVKRALIKFVPKHNILMIGSTGTGKSNIILTLENPREKAIDRRKRTHSSKSYIFKINGEYYQFIDVPGQEMHKSKREDAIKEVIRKVEGVLHIVCYGYHETRDDAIDDAVKDENTPNEDYLKKKREGEFNNIIELSKFYGAGNKTTWFLTVISKADLWWDKREEVVKYYSEGDYQKAISNNLYGVKSDCVEYCSIMHKYYGKLKLSGNFDDDEKLCCRDNFISMIVDMASANKRKKILR